MTPAPLVSQASAREKPDTNGGGEIRLNLGGRNKPIAGFKTVDLYEGPEVDIRSDCSDLSVFKDGSVSEIYASHILEHWPHTQTLKVLTEWRRVLKKGGKAFISVPDFEAAVKLYEKVGLSDFIRNLLWGDQNYALAFHYAGFIFSTLAMSLMQAGFSDVKRIRWLPYDVNDCSHNFDTWYKKPISVNVEAIA